MKTPFRIIALSCCALLLSSAVADTMMTKIKPGYWKMVTRMRIDAAQSLEGLPPDTVEMLKSLGYNNEIVRTDYLCTNGDLTKAVTEKLPAGCKMSPFKIRERTFDLDYTCAGVASHIHMTFDTPEHYNMSISAKSPGFSMSDKSDLTFVSVTCPKKLGSDPLPSFDAFLKKGFRVKPGYWEAETSLTSNIKDVWQRLSPSLTEERRATMQGTVDNLIRATESASVSRECISGDLKQGLMGSKLNEDCPLSEPRLEGDRMTADGVCKTPAATFSAEITRQDGEHYVIKAFQSVPAGPETLKQTTVVKAHFVSSECPAGTNTTPSAGAAADPAKTRD